MLLLTLVQMIAGENPWFVALYGLRSYLLPFPVAFIIGDVLNEEDLRKFGVCTLWLLLPMTALEVAQYYSPRTAFLNAGASKGAQQLDYAFGHVRASGTFSYVTGPTLFVPMAAAFLFYGFVNEKFAKRWLLWASAAALIVSVPVTGSRSQIALLFGLLACVALAAMSGVSQLASSLKVVVAILVVTVLVSQLPAFLGATGTLQERISEASGSEGGVEGSLVSRVAHPFAEGFEYSISSAWYGKGIGVGSNVASTLLTGSQQFLAGETEIGRVFIEFGPLSGGAFILFRVLLAVMIAARAFSRVRDLQPLAWFLFPVMSYELVLGTVEQPTSQGFMVITLGLTLAALKSHVILSDLPRVLNQSWGRQRFNSLR
jgi:hypothetical protein